MKKLARGLLLAAVAAFSLPAAAADYPDKTVTIVVPFGAGGATDVAARVIASALEAKWGQPVVVENAPGAGGITGTRSMLNKDADGYTLLCQVTTLPGYPVFKKEVPFDPLTDLAAITLYAEGTFALVASKDSPFDTFDEMIAYAKAHPGELNYSGTGPGALMMNMETIKRQYGVDIQQVLYKGAAANYTAVLSGEVQLTLTDLGRAKEDMAVGNLKVLGISGTVRSPIAPEVPTLKELGADGVNGFWIGLFARAGTPDDIINKIQGDIAEAAAQPEMVEALSKFTFRLIASTPEEMGERLANDISSWTEIFEALGLEKS